MVEKYLSNLNMLVNASYWDSHYPRLVTKAMIKKMSCNKNSRLKFISDMSCDVGGSVELTYKTTTQKKPVYTYDPLTEKYKVSSVEVMDQEFLVCRKEVRRSKDSVGMV